MKRLLLKILGDKKFNPALPSKFAKSTNSRKLRILTSVKFCSRVIKLENMTPQRQCILGYCAPLLLSPIICSIGCSIQPAVSCSLNNAPIYILFKSTAQIAQQFQRILRLLPDKRNIIHWKQFNMQNNCIYSSGGSRYRRKASETLK